MITERIYRNAMLRLKFPTQRWRSARLPLQDRDPPSIMHELPGRMIFLIISANMASTTSQWVSDEAMLPAKRTHFARC
jgi:hypothetical protein